MGDVTADVNKSAHQMRQSYTIMNNYTSITTAPSTNVTPLQHSSFDLAFYKYFYQVTVPLLFGIITIVGLIGNGLVILVIVTRRKMRTALHFLLLNLAVADICFLLFCVPFTAYHYAAETWIFGPAVCKLTQFLLYVTAYVSVYTLALISAWRLMSVVYSSETTLFRTKCNAWLSVCVLWVLCLLGNAPVFVVYDVRSTKQVNEEQPYKYCAPAMHGRNLFLSFFLIAYVIPLSAISIMSVRLVHYIQRRRAFAMRTASITSESSVHVSERTNQVTRTIITVVFVFAICWMPMHITLLVAQYGYQPETYAYQVFRVFSQCLAYANSCMNPFIYNRMSTAFRQSFRETAEKCRRSGSEARYENSPGLNVNGLTAINGTSYC